MRKFLAVLLALTLMLGTAVTAGAAENDIPREETLINFIGQWGPVQNLNPISGTQASSVSGGRPLIYETLLMYNQLTNEGEPLLATGYEWLDDYNIELKLNPAAKFADGTPFTSADVVYTYELHNKYGFQYASSWVYLDKIEAKDDNTVVFTLKEDPYNKLDILKTFTQMPMLPKHVWEGFEADAGNDAAELRNFFNEDPLGSGPFKMYYYDETKIVMIRDDNYWGQDASMFGKLTPVKYYTIPIFQSNDVGNLAFQNGEVDISQSFISDVQNMIEAEGSKIRTYLPELPFYVPGSMPSLIFNTTRPGLDDPVVRRAIALCIDYAMIAEMAMSGYTDKITPSLLVLTTAEVNYINNDDPELEALRWDTYDVENNVVEANRLLDEAGYLDVDGDGFREMPDGSPIDWKAECPYGWSDWNASIEITAMSCEEIGIKLTPYFPEAPIRANDMQSGDFDIMMETTEGALDPSQPWKRARGIMYSEGVAPVGEQAFWNYGRYSNARADELIDLIAGTDDMDKIREYYTELDKIYLTDLPSIPLMYRPWLFYTFNETYWTGFPTEGDGSNIPPQVAIDGAAIRTLYVIEPVQQ